MKELSSTEIVSEFYFLPPSVRLSVCISAPATENISRKICDIRENLWTNFKFG
jgi:hypothetical protein